MKRVILLVWVLVLFCGCASVKKKERIESTELFEHGIVCVPSDSLSIGVVLLAGSGCVDADYSVQDAKIYRDLAHGLADQKITSLRFEKRNCFCDSSMSSIQEEILDDAQKAIALMRTQTKLVYVVAHSLSASVASVLEEEADGLILLAGSVSEMEEVYALQLMRNAEESEKEQIMQELKLILNLKEDSGFSWFGLKESWWISLDQLHLKERISQLTKPVLVMHGSLDLQVDKKELFSFGVLLKEHPNAEFVLFDGLGHFFLDEKGQHLDESVIEKIASWILAQSSFIIKQRSAANEKSNFNC